jgi:O-antigen/teichoic acid export membrane protein
MNRPVSRLALANAANAFSSNIASVLTARIAGPAVLGLVNSVTSFASYSSLMTGGAADAMYRLVPIACGSGQQEEADRIARTALSFALAGGALFFLAGVGVGLSSPAGANSLHICAPAAGLLGVFNVLCSYALLHTGSYHRLGVLAAMVGAQGVASLATVPLASFGFYPMLGRVFIITSIPAIGWMCMNSFTPKLPNRREAIDLVRAGIPLVAIATALALTIALDRNLIFMCMGPKEVGLYAIASFATNTHMLVHTTASQVLMPRLGALFGESKNEQVVARAALAQLPKLAVVGVCVAAIVYVAVEPLTRLVLPKFLPGVPTARLAALGGCALALTPTSAFHVIVGRSLQLLGFFAAGLVVQVSVSLYLFHSGHGLDSFALGLAAGLATRAMLICLDLVRLARRSA